VKPQLLGRAVFKWFKEKQYLCHFCAFVTCFNYPIKIMIASEPEVLLFKPLDRIDLQSGIALNEKMNEVIPNPNQLWVIDLGSVNFMDSSGLVPLVNALKTARNNSCRLVLCNVKSPVKLVLELTQLDSVFEIFNSYEDVLTIANSNPGTTVKLTDLNGNQI
jgi:anti-sigma B factor antagonist